MTKKEYLQSVAPQVASIIFEQIVTETPANVVASWAIHGVGAGTVSVNNVDMACLTLHVDALIHKGVVCVAYDDGADTYHVALYSKDKCRVSPWRDDVYFNELGTLIDQLIERPVDMSDEDYEILADADTFAKTGLHLY